MTEDAPSGRWQQRRRTRRELLRSARDLAAKAGRPSLEDVAEEAGVSRATAYRYFPNVDALMVEAALDLAVPAPETVFEGVESEDPRARIITVEKALFDMIGANETPLRLMLAHSLERRAKDSNSGEPVRQNRRTPLIDAALDPGKSQFRPSDYKFLKAALALILGPEAMVVFKDVLQMDDGEAAKVRRWAIEALVEAARK